MSIRKSFIMITMLFFLLADTYAENITDLIKESGITGGLIVHAGCGDGQTTVQFTITGSFYVHGIDRNRENIHNARKRTALKKVPLKISFSFWQGDELPYIDNLVNILILENPKEVSEQGILRVLSPNGIAYIKENNQWKTLKNPRPKEMDEWTHYMHGPDNNAVAEDTLIGPPRRLQWNGAPKWTRSHEKMSSLHAMVSARGRIFYIVDEGLTASVQLPPQWKLIARDAFNGIVLWKREIPEWHPHLWPLKSGHALLPRRVVAYDNHVFVTLGITAPLSMLDAATGKTIKTFNNTKGTEEIIYSDGKVFLVVDENPRPDEFKPQDPFCWYEKARVTKKEEWAMDKATQNITVLDTDTGKIAWKKTTPIAPLSLTVGKKNVYYSSGDRVICLDRKTGKEKWKSKIITRRAVYGTHDAPTMVLYKNTLLYLVRTLLIAFNAETGEQLWKTKHSGAGHNSPSDVLVINDLVWTANRNAAPFEGKSLLTGEIKVEFSPEEMTWFHPRCHRSKGTVNFILASRTGIELADVRKKTVDINHWIRGGCVYGVMPANGLIYTPPHSCACLMETKVMDLSAYAPVLTKQPRAILDKDRLYQGPAFRKIHSNKENNNSWPTYRHDSKRSGYYGSSLSHKIKKQWQVEIESRPGSLTAANGKVFAVAVDSHTVYSIDSQTGKIIWTYICGGRVDSPPTIYDGMVIFGSHDGNIYCLRESDGELVYRFYAGPAHRNIVSYGQVESTHPIHGSVLVQNGVVTFVAGRSMFLDNGLYLYQLDARTGKILTKENMNEKDPESGQNLQKLQDGWKGLTLPVALPDILSSDGNRIYMRSQPFDMKGKRLRVKPDIDVEHQDKEGYHLFSPVGFLDDSWMHRNYWMLGTTGTYGWRTWFDGGRFGPSGRILSFNDKYVFGFGRHPAYLSQAPIIEYQIFMADIKPEKQGPERVLKTGELIENQGKNAREKREFDKTQWKIRKKYSSAELSAAKFLWIQKNPQILARAMVLTPDVLFIAGLPNLVNEESIWDNPDDKELQKKLMEQNDAWAGKKGGKLAALSTKDGRILKEYDLDAPPVFDGMIVSEGSLFISLVNGSIYKFSP